MNEINLPPNADEINPEDCSCGLPGCTEHQSWGEWLLDQIYGAQQSSPEQDSLLASLANHESKTVEQIALEHGVSAKKASEIQLSANLADALRDILSSLREDDAAEIRRRFGLENPEA